MRRDLSLRLLFSAVFLILFSVLQGQSGLPFYEAFDYVPDQFLHNQPGWSLAYTGTEPVVRSGSLEYPGLPASRGNKVTFDGSGGDPFLVFTTQNTPGSKVFYSFIFQVTSVAGLNLTGTHFSGFQSGTTGGCMIWLKSNGNGGFYIGHSSRAATGISWSSSSYQVNTPVFIAGCYEITGSYSSTLIPGDDKTYLWVDPDMSSFGLTNSPEPTFECSMATGTPSKDLADLKSFYIRQDASTTTPFIEMDELRIGLSWKQVTAETSPPSWKAGFPKIDEVTSSQFSLFSGLDEPGRTYFAIFPAGSPVPSSADVKAGDGAVKSGFLECPGDNLVYSLVLGGLTRNTAYSVFCVGEDIHGNLQPEPVMLSFTTLRSDPPAVNSSSESNDVDHDIDLVFGENEEWQTAVNEIKVGGISLEPDDWDKNTAGKITLMPRMGNPLLTIAGIKTITVVSDGYNDAALELTINRGAFSKEKSGSTITGQLLPGEEAIVSLTARDQFSNPMPGYIFRVDAIVTNVTKTIDEVHKINGIGYSVSAESIDLSPAGTEGVSEFSIQISEQNDAFDGFSVNVRLNDGITDFGSYSYFEPGIAELVTESALDELNLDEGICTIKLINEEFNNPAPDKADCILSQAPEGLIIKEIILESESEALVVFDYDGTDFDTDFSCTITIDAQEVTRGIPLTGVFMVRAVFESVPSVSTDPEITANGTITASWGGNVTSDGGEEVTSKGICWSTSPMPDINGSRTDEASGTGPVSGLMTGLEPDTKYYVRAYATNIEGTGYGEERVFTTASDAANDAGLTTINIDGEPIGGFSSDIFSYDIMLEFGTTAIPVLTCSLSDSRATAVINEASSVPGSSVIIVTAEDGTTNLIYTVNFTISAPSGNTELSGIELDGITIPGFNASVFEYEYLLPFGTQSPPHVSATASEFSTLAITQPQSVNGTSVIVVTAQDGISQSTYTITFGIDEYIYRTGFENTCLPFQGWIASDIAIELPAENHAGFTGDYALSFNGPGTGYLKTSMYPNSGKLEFWLSCQGTCVNERLLIHRRTKDSPDSLLVGELTSVQFSGNDWKYFSFDIDVADSTYIILTSDLQDNNEARLWIDDLSLTGKIITAVPHMLSEEKLKIYPNPAHEYVTLELYDAEIWSFGIYNSAGMKIFENRATGPVMKIDVSSLDEGFYIIRIKVSEGIITRKFLKI